MIDLIICFPFNLYSCFFEQALLSSSENKHLAYQKCSMDALLHFRHFPALLQGEMNRYLRELKRLAHLGCDKQTTWTIASKVFDHLLKID